MYSTKFEMPSSSLSSAPSSACGLRPLTDSHTSGMSSPSLSVTSGLSKPVPPKPLSERSGPPSPTTPPLVPPPPAPPVEVDVGTVAGSPTGRTSVVPPGPGRSIVMAGPRREASRSISDELSPVARRTGFFVSWDRPCVQVDQPSSGAASAPTPSTPATSPAATVPANLRSRTATGRSAPSASRCVFVNGIQFPFRGNLSASSTGSFSLKGGKVERLRARVDERSTPAKRLEKPLFRCPEPTNH